MSSFIWTKIPLTVISQCYSLFGMCVHFETVFTSFNDPVILRSVAADIKSSLLH